MGGIHLSAVSTRCGVANHGETTTGRGYRTHVDTPFKYCVPRTGVPRTGVPEPVK